jgi:excisionase family DNA binding protein
MPASSTEVLLWNVEQTARVLGVKPETVYFWAQRGRIPCIRLSARALRFHPDDIREWLRTNTYEVRA